MLAAIHLKHIGNVMERYVVVFLLTVSCTGSVNVHT